MADQFVVASFTGVEYAERFLQKWVTRIPVLTLQLPHEAAGPVMDVLLPAVVAATPVKTGTLAQETAGVIPPAEGPVHMQIFSDAVNDRTGFPYARARAYGFNTVKGEFWTPPEQPPYPIQGIRNAVMPVLVLGPTIMRTVGI